jgi:dTDP-4-amino-4,6-dideoxygalactose transaminase
LRVPLSDPVREFRDVRDEVLAAVGEVLASGRYILGETVDAFEQEFARLVGVSHAVGVASGTDAVELALEALGVGPGDEVVTTPFTFLATATAINRTAAIVPVHLFGQMVDVDALGAIADRHGLPIVEDAAQAFGATRVAADGSVAHAGGVGVAGAFSFYPTKSLGAAGDGGIITTDDAAVAERLVRLRNHGRTATGVHSEPGHNSRLDAVQAAFLSAKLPVVERWTERRLEHAAAYGAALSDVPGISPPVADAGNRHIFHQYTVLCHGRERVLQAMADAGVSAAKFYDPPVHRLEALEGRDWRTDGCPVADELSTRVLSIPVFAHLTEEERDRVVETLVASGSLQPG